MEMGRRRFVAVRGLAPLAAVMPTTPARGHRFAFASDGVPARRPAVRPGRNEIVVFDLHQSNPNRSALPAH